MAVISVLLSNTFLKKIFMRKILYLLFYVFFSCFCFSQNLEIKESGGALLPSTLKYCESAMFNLEVADYSSSSSQSVTTEPIGNFSNIINDTSNEQEVIFSAPVIATDKFSYPIDLGFSFNFFGSVYTRVVVGSNGRLVFTNDALLDTLHDTTAFTDKVLPAVPLPSPDYNKIYKAGDLNREVKMAQIFAAFTKLRVNASTGGYKYKKFSDGTNRGILISFQSVIPHNGMGADLGSFFTSRIILFEDGRVILNVQNKSGGTYNAILGMQNEAGTQMIIPGPATNNNSIWNSASSDAYVINTGSVRTPAYLWELDRNNDGTVDETSSTRFFPNYTPLSDVEKLSVKISFLESSGIKTSQVLFEKIKTPVIEGTLNCVYDMRVTDATYDSNFVYTWYRVGENSPVGSGRNLSLHREGSTVGNYFVKISTPNDSDICPGSNESNLLRFESQRFPGLVRSAFCLTDNTLSAPQSKTISLYDTFYPKYNPASGLEPYKIVFTANGQEVSDADAANFAVPANTELKLQFAVKDSTGTNACHTGTLALYYLKMPPTKTISLCSSVKTYNLKSVFQDSTYPLRYYYYYTYADDGSVADGSAVDVSRKVNVKTSAVGAGSCFANTVVDFVLGDTVSLPDIPMQERCAGTDTNSNRFDFNLIKATLDPANQYDVKFYTKGTNTEILPVGSAPSEVPNLNFSGYFWSAHKGDYIVYAKVINRGDPNCFSVSSDIVLRVYTKPAIRVANPVLLKNCQGNTIFDLRQDPDDLTNAGSTINLKLEYYSPSNVLLSNSDIMQYDANVLGANPYIKVIYNISCSDIIKFDLSYNPKPTAFTSPISICSELNYTLQDFKNKAVAVPSNYTFTDLLGNPLPASFSVSSLPSTVNFLLKDNKTGCTSDPQSITFVKGANAPLLTNSVDITGCDSDFDGKVDFNLDGVKKEFTKDLTATFEYFKDATLRQSVGPIYTNETAFAQTVFVRITIPNYCPSVAKINLKVNSPKQSSTLQKKYYICFNITLLIDAGSENTIFAWSDGQTSQTAKFTEPGTYSVTLKNGTKGCPYTHTFTISDENQPKIEVINQSNSSLEVVANGGVKPYRYYFNGAPQISNILQNPSASSYVVQVESATGCFGPPKTVYFININNAFTPNGDGKNDVWKIDNLEKMEQVSMVITDRYGSKVFEAKNPTKTSWNGTLNGRTLPTSSYWYEVSWFDPLTQKTERRQGWVFLKNRE